MSPMRIMVVEDDATGGVECTAPGLWEDCAGARV